MTTPTLFDLLNPEPAPRVAPPAPRGIARGRREGARAAAHANRVDPAWLETACKAVLTWAEQQAEPWLFETARAAVVLLVPVPPDLRAWGGVASALVNRKQIEPAGHAAADSSHGALKRTWRVRQ